jgi:hypothetical protein
MSNGFLISRQNTTKSCENNQAIAESCDSSKPREKRNFHITSLIIFN